MVPVFQMGEQIPRLTMQLKPSTLKKPFFSPPEFWKNKTKQKQQHKKKTTKQKKKNKKTKTNNNNKRNKTKTTKK